MILFFLLTVMVNFTKQEIIGSLEHPLFKNLTGSTKVLKKSICSAGVVNSVLQTAPEPKAKV